LRYGSGADEQDPQNRNPQRARDMTGFAKVPPEKESSKADCKEKG